MVLPHQNLAAWQRADDMYIDVHRLTLQRFPAHERYELGSQVRRAAYSVPANIVEGIARESARERIRFFTIAAASLRELGYGLHAAMRLGYITKDDLTGFDERLQSIAAPLHGLIRKHRARQLAKATTIIGALAFTYAQLY